MENLLEVKNLTITFNSKKYLNNLSYSLKKGDTLSIVGESGSGKTISALSILKLLNAKCIEGQILFEGRDILRLPPNDLRALRGKDISFVFQDPMAALNPLLSVYDQLEEALRAHSTCKKEECKGRIISLLKETGLDFDDAKLRCYPHQFSGGQRQRILIAMALAANPKLLIADEPTTALDVTVQAQIISLLKKLQEKRKMSLIFITHNLALAKQMAHNILVLKAGEEQEYGEAQKIFSSPENTYTKELLSSVLDMRTLPAKAAPAESAPVILEVKNLDKTYGKTHAVNNISFTLKKGEVAALVGESGSGKTTAAKLILGLEKADSGEIKFNNVKPFGVQAVFQDPYSTLDPRQTVRDILLEPLEIHDFDKTERTERIATLLKSVGLSEDILPRYPHEFSGGQRQRIAIARALALEPEVLILDEPTSALDVTVQAQILNLFKDIQARFNLTFIFITHDLAAAKFMANTVYVMQNGQIVEGGAASKIFSAPKEVYTQNLFNAVPSL